MVQPGTDANPLRVAIIGAGPSGFYTAGRLFKREGLVVEIDVFDRLPTPFGLVRGGVAPDHQRIKSVTRRVGQGLAGYVLVTSRPRKNVTRLRLPNSIQE